jgi:hypothetical protein
VYSQLHLGQAGSALTEAASDWECRKRSYRFLSPLGTTFAPRTMLLVAVAIAAGLLCANARVPSRRVLPSPNPSAVPCWEGSLAGRAGMERRHYVGAPTASL